MHIASPCICRYAKRLLAFQNLLPPHHKIPQPSLLSTHHLHHHCPLLVVVIAIVIVVVVIVVFVVSSFFFFLAIPLSVGWVTASFNRFVANAPPPPHRQQFTMVLHNPK